MTTCCNFSNLETAAVSSYLIIQMDIAEAHNSYFFLFSYTLYEQKKIGYSLYST